MKTNSTTYENKQNSKNAAPVNVITCFVASILLVALPIVIMAFCSSIFAI